LETPWFGGVFFLLSCSANGGYITIYCPVLMTLLLLKVSGVALLEKGLIKTRGDDYKDYIKNTSTFIPWFPKKDK